MYSLLLVSTDKGFTNLSLKFIPHLESSIKVTPVNSVGAAMVTLGATAVDIVLFDHSADNDIRDMIRTMDRAGLSTPVLLVTKQADVDMLSEAINDGIAGFVDRNGKDPLEYFKNICDRTVITVERAHASADRLTSMKRLASLVEMAKMSDKDFSEIVNYALETAVEITKSDSGFVARYDKDRRMLRMLAWSKGAMKRCDITNYPVEFALDTTGVWGDPIRNGKSVIINDYEGDCRLLKKGIPEGHMALKRILLVPLFAEDGGIIGTGGVANKESEYTNSDESQLSLLLGEMFSMFVRRETLKMYSAPAQVVKELTEVGPIGLAFITTEMDLAFLNRVGIRAMGLDQEVELPVIAESIKTPQMQTIIDLVNRLRTHGGMSLKGGVSTKVGNKTRSYSITVYSTAGAEDMHPGFTVIMTDVTDLMRLDEVASRVKEHVSILEGPVLDSLLTARPFLLMARPGLSDDKVVAVDKLNETILFMADYKNVGMMQPIWIDLNDAAREARNFTVSADFKVNIRTNGIKVLADPAFPSVFRQLFVNSVVHGEYTSEITIKCTIVDGSLKIIYEDNGVGIDPDMRANIFDLVYEGKFGMFLIYNIVTASGFSIKYMPRTTGTAFEIDVPASKYTME